MTVYPPLFQESPTSEGFRNFGKYTDTLYLIVQTLILCFLAYKLKFRIDFAGQVTLAVNWLGALLRVVGDFSNLQLAWFWFVF